MSSALSRLAHPELATGGRPTISGYAADAVTAVGYTSGLAWLAKPSRPPWLVALSVAANWSDRAVAAKVDAESPMLRDTMVGSIVDGGVTFLSLKQLGMHPAIMAAVVAGRVWLNQTGHGIAAMAIRDGTLLAALAKQARWF